MNLTITCPGCGDPITLTIRSRIEAGDHTARAAEVRVWASELDQRGML